jgi:protein TonB
MQVRAPVDGFRLGLLISLAGHAAVLVVAANVVAGPGGSGGGGGGGGEPSGFELRLTSGPTGGDAAAAGEVWAEGTLDPRREPELPAASNEAAETPEPLAWLGALPVPDPAAQDLAAEVAPEEIAAPESPPAEVRVSAGGASSDGATAAEADRLAAATRAAGGEGGAGAVPGPLPEGPPASGSELGLTLAAGDGIGQSASGRGAPGPQSEDRAPGTGGPGPARTPPVLVREKGLDYPRAARSLGHEGRVLLKIEVSARGEVIDVEVVESSGHALLDQAARVAVRAWDFRPATERGVPVRGSLLHRIVFRLEEAS